MVVNEHATLNSSKGVIYLDDLRDMSEAEILEGLKSQKVTQVYKIKKNFKGELVNTALCILTFKSSSTPQSIKVGFHQHVHVDQYIPNPMKCANCFKYGHTKKFCKSERVCVHCSQLFHEGPCNSKNQCVNCNDEHNNLSRDCNRFKVEKDIQKIMTVDKIPIGEARKKLKSRNHISNIR